MRKADVRSDIGLSHPKSESRKIERAKVVFNSNIIVMFVTYMEYNLRLFNNSVFECLEPVTYLDPRLRGDDGR